MLSNMPLTQESFSFISKDQIITQEESKNWVEKTSSKSRRVLDKDEISVGINAIRNVTAAHIPLILIAALMEKDNGPITLNNFVESVSVNTFNKYAQRDSGITNHTHADWSSLSELFNSNQFNFVSQAFQLKMSGVRELSIHERKREILNLIANFENSFNHNSARALRKAVTKLK